jgi:predicted TIM-barrel fold metal-dependent hydrolase
MQMNSEQIVPSGGVFFRGLRIRLDARMPAEIMADGVSGQVVYNPSHPRRSRAIRRSREEAMTPVIDAHVHVFRGRDIPLKGYFLSRDYPEWYIRLFAPALFAVLEDVIRGEIRGPLAEWIERIAFAFTGPGYRRWADILSLTDMGAVARRFAETYAGDRIGLSIPLMVDFEYWFRPSKKHPIAEQIDAMYRDVVLPSKGRVHPFAPFDPARELAYRAKLPPPGEADGGPPEKYSPLEMAAEAVRNKGFVGVKVYNSFGYRPLGNAAVDAERRRIFSGIGLSRYNRFGGAAFDGVLSELYRFCEREQVPITAHCVRGAIEAYPDASLAFDHPAYWRPVLEKFPGLHVNLAHFGWGRPEDCLPGPRGSRILRFLRDRTRRRRLPDGSGGSWVREIAGMMAAFPGLYADVAHHPILDDADIPKFRKGYTELIRDFPEVLPKRLLFGTDWHVIVHIDRYAEFKERYRRILAGIFSGRQLRDFEGGNALRFLGLLPPARKERGRWSKNWRRLKSFYRKNRMAEPKWFRDASEYKEA